LPSKNEAEFNPQHYKKKKKKKEKKEGMWQTNISTAFIKQVKGNEQVRLLCPNGIL
jgi:hypothetical protein